METTKPIFWYQGLFLQPQHFQQWDQYHSTVLKQLTTRRQPYYWGVGQLEVQTAALQNETFEINKGEFIFPDGSWILAPGNAHIYARAFNKTNYKEGKPLTVYLGLPKWKQEAANVTEINGNTATSAITTRYVCQVEPEEVKDLYSTGPVAQIRLLHYAVKVFWDSEVADLSDYSLLPVAQLQHDGREVKLSDRYIPPAFALSGSDVLGQVTRQIREQLAARCHQLEEYKRPLRVRKTELDQSYLVYAMILNSLTKYVPLLYQATEHGSAHPWSLYGHLRQLVGELSSFTDRIDVFGKLADGRELLPPYQHDNLGTCFQEAQKLIEELLHNLMIVPESFIQLKREKSLFSATMPPDSFSLRNEYYLAVSSGASQEKIVEVLERQGKITSVEQVPTLVQRALPGVPLEYTLYPPPGLSKRPDLYYFKLNPNHEQWMEIRQKQNIALFWDQAPEDARAEIVILKG